MRVSALFLVASLSSGCFLFRDDLPDDSCESDQDCFRAQGEVCDPDARVCVMGDGPDAGPTVAPPVAPTPSDPEAPADRGHGHAREVQP